MPRRWTDLDTDAHRLPYGFTRAGYDSGTRRYHFRDAEGRMYQGEPGEEFGGRLAPMNGTDSSMRHRFAPDDDEVEARKLVDSPRNLEADDRRLVSTAPTRQATRPTPNAPSSFSEFLTSNQMATAPNPEPRQKESSDRSLRSSLRRLTRFRSTKPKSASLPNPPPAVNEWGHSGF